MAFLHLVDRAIGAACRAILYLTLGVVFAILTANVVLRYVAGTSIASASELPELLFPWMIMAGVVLAGGSLVVAVLYAALAATAWPLMEIAADERSPVLQVPGSISVGCLVIGFAMLSIVTLCRLPEVWAGAEVPHGHDDPEVAASHQGA